MPPNQQAPAHCHLQTRIPGTGEAVQLRATQPAATWSATCSHTLISLLPQAMAKLQHMPHGLLVGLLPYPATAPLNSHSSQPTLLLFEAHTRHGGTSTARPNAMTQATRPPAARQPGDHDFCLHQPFTAETTAAAYMAGVQRIKAYLAAGDVYQVNLAQRFAAPYAGDPRTAYDALRAEFQPPFAAYIDLGERQILSFSPESFLEVAGKTVVTRPIKGTRPRHADPEVDARLAADLATHPKDRAENLMIVDLLRNDLGKVCVPGSVQTPTLFRVESFHNVHHLVSTVSGQLQAGCGIPELLAACFPGGSITGAPKKRAMEIIAELEPQPRDLYCGSIFWLTADGNFGSNIAIRTFVAHAGTLHGWAGAGIVADSDPAAEYQECLDKLAPLMRSLEKQFLRR